MASSSGSGGSGESGSGGERRYPHNLEGLLRFSTEHTVTEDATGPSNLTNIDPEVVKSIHPSHGKPPHYTAAATSAPNDPQLARINQDRALEVLGLHRYRVAGDGNCLFRAVAWHLQMEQESYHPILRKSAVEWMRANKDELLEWGLLDSEKEIDETEELGVWPGQAAIVALANIFSFNIAVIQGGDKGDIDIQHICPFETAVQAEGEKGSVILAYLYNGHYDAIVDQPNLANPEFEAWTIRRKRECEADEALARRLAAEECYNDSIAPPSHSSLSSPPTVIPDQTQQHVSEVYVSSHTKPLHDKTTQKRESPLVVHSFDPTPKKPAPKIAPAAASKPSHPILPATTSTSVTMKASEKPHRPPPRKSLSEDEYHRNDENRMRITLYPKKQASLDEFTESNRHLYKPTPAVDHQLRVIRSSTDTNVLQNRRLRDINPTPPPRTRSPSIRVIPILFVGRQTPQHVSNVAVGTGSTQQGRDFDRRAAMRRKEYAEKGPNNTWTQTSTESYCPTGGHHSDRIEQFHHQRMSTTASRLHATCDPTSLPRHNVIRHRSYDRPTASSTYDRSENTSTTPPAYGLPRGAVSSVSPEVPVVVLSARSPDGVLPSSHHTRARATPAPATYDLNQPFDMPPQLRPYRSTFSPRHMDMMLRRNFRL